jgi:hypothetical protein
MDRMQIEDLDIHEGIDNTLTILGYQAPTPGEGRPQLRRVAAADHRGSELNQVDEPSNALDALDGQGTITITTRMSGLRIAVDIQDDGLASRRDPEQDLRPVLHHQAGRQGHRAGPDIARRIVVGHRGNISVKSWPGETRFTVMLPTGEKRSILPPLAVIRRPAHYARGTLANFVISWQDVNDASRRRLADRHRQLPVDGSGPDRRRQRWSGQPGRCWLPVRCWARRHGLGRRPEPGHRRLVGIIAGFGAAATPR